MAQNDFFKRYLDAGLEFRDMTQQRAESLVQDLVDAGEVRADQAREAVSEFLERSRKSSERLIETVRDEVKAQITNLGLASKDDVDRAEKRLLELFGAGGARKRARKSTSAAKKTTKKAAKKATKKASGAKKTAARKTAAKKTAAKRSTAKKTAAARKSTAKRTAAKRATAKKTTAKRSPAKKTAAKKA
jgi:polyhydroxyalkanoate synthesis regulator phasin